MAIAFKKIAIIGLGLIGGSLAAAIKKLNSAQFIMGIDDEAVIQKALNKELIDEGASAQNLQISLTEADLVILATPIRQILQLLKTIGSVLKPGALVTDVGSTKEIIMETANQHLPGDVYFLGGHPMAGSEKRGIDHADYFLFENAIYVITKTKAIPANLIDQFVELISSIGAHVLFLDADDHDQMAAMVSHVPQILAVSLMNCLAQLGAKDPNYYNLAAGGFRDMTRIASSPFSMWSDIFNTNKKNVERGLEQLLIELNKNKELLTNPKLATVFEEALHARLAIPKDTRGFMLPNFDISIVVEDKPGMIAKIANLMASRKINIKDIEILKIREGESGAMRLALESESDRDTALKLLNKNGFEAAKR